MSEVQEMAHKTLINGTEYAISGGKALVNGTEYEIDVGKTLVDGTVYEIAFAPSMITVNISGPGNASYCYVTINGKKHYAEATLEIEPGTTITAVANSGSSQFRKNCFVQLNGKKVASGTSGGGAEYSFIPDCTVVDIELNGSMSVKDYSSITITTE